MEVLDAILKYKDLGFATLVIALQVYALRTLWAHTTTASRECQERTEAISGKMFEIVQENTRTTSQLVDAVKNLGRRF